MVFGVAAFLLACGQYGGLYRLQTLVPLVNRFRFPCRAIVLVELCIAVGRGDRVGGCWLNQGGVGMMRPQSSSGRALAVALARQRGAGHRRTAGVAEFVAAPALIWCGPLLVGDRRVADRAGRTGTTLGAGGAGALDGCRFGLLRSELLDARRTADLHEFVAEISRPPGAADVRVAAADSAKGSRTGDRMLLAGLDRIDGYAGLEPRKVSTIRRPTRCDWPARSWYWQDDAARRSRVWVPIEPTAPRARLVSREQCATRIRRELTTLEANQAWCDEPIELGDGRAPEVRRVVDDLPGHMTVEHRCRRGNCWSRPKAMTRLAGGRGGRRAAGCAGQRGFSGVPGRAGRAASRARVPARQPVVRPLVTACGLELLVCFLVVRFCQGHDSKRSREPRPSRPPHDSPPDRLDSRHAPCCRFTTKRDVLAPLLDRVRAAIRRDRRAGGDHLCRRRLARRQRRAARRAGQPSTRTCA